jgi:hypothetical protein
MASTKSLCSFCGRSPGPALSLANTVVLRRTDALDLVREATAAGLHVALSPSATERLLHHQDFA